MKIQTVANEIFTSANDPIKEIARLTQVNDHNEARILTAKFLKMKKYEKLFTAIKQITEIEKYLPAPINEYRYQIFKEMMKFAKSKLDKETYEKLYSAL